MHLLSLEYTKVYIKEVLRNPSAAFFTLAFPALLLQMFGYYKTDATPITYIVYCNYAVQTVMLQTLGISVSVARTNLFTNYLKTLPVSNIHSIIGRICSSLVFAFLSLSIVVIVLLLNHESHIALKSHLIIVTCALVGGIPIAMLAILLGNLLNPIASKNIFILLNLLLLFGSYTFTENGTTNIFKEFIPSYQWLSFSTHMLLGNNIIAPTLWMLSYTLLFFLLNQLRFKFKS